MKKAYPAKKYENDLIKIFKGNRGCFYPDCDCKKSDVIKSHSMQRSGNLSLIAEENHVYQYKITIDCIDQLISDNYFPPVKIGINVASTFLGFCSSHDKQLFQDIEDSPIIPSIHQINLITFRSLCSELYRKTSAAESSSVLTEVLSQSPINDPFDLRRNEIAKHHVEVANEGTRMGESVMISTYGRFCSYLQGNSTLNLEYLLLKLDQIPQVLCSSSFNPAKDCDNNPLQVLAMEKEAIQGVFLNIFINESTGYVLFSWEKEHIEMKEFICNLLSQSDISNTIIALMFDYIENHAFNITWWEKLSNIKKRDICYRVIDVYHLNDFRSPKKYVNWGFSAITNSRDIEIALVDKGILTDFNSD